MGSSRRVNADPARGETGGWAGVLPKPSQLPRIPVPRHSWPDELKGAAMTRYEPPGKRRHESQGGGAIADHAITRAGSQHESSGANPDRPTHGDAGPPSSEAYSANPSAASWHATTIPCPDPFIRQLEYEKRRADRTKSPLSIVFFRVAGAGRSRGRCTSRLQETILAHSRATDIPARIGDDLIAVLLLDTNCDGAKVFARKILAHSAGMTISTIEQTYPDQLLDNLASDCPDPRDPRSPVVAHPTSSGRKRFLPAALSAATLRWRGMPRFETE